MNKIKEVLIIDDDIMTAHLHKRLLENLMVANEVAYMTDPYQALVYLHERYSTPVPKADYPDLILLDLDMPNLNGFLFLDDLETLPIDRSRIFIVMLTSSVSTKDKERAAQMGSKLDGYLVKPLRKETVEKLLTSMRAYSLNYASADY